MMNQSEHPTREKGIRWKITATEINWALTIYGSILGEDYKVNEGCIFYIYRKTLIFNEDLDGAEIRKFLLSLVFIYEFCLGLIFPTINHTKQKLPTY